jgi:hypothetical protein
MRIKVFLALAAVAAFAVPTGALAVGHGKKPKPTKQTTYVFHGTLSAYTAAAGATSGSVTIVVSGSNKAGRPFVGQPVTFAVPSTTKVDPAGAAITNGDLGMIQVKGPAGMTDPLVLGAVAPKLVEDETLAGPDGD